MGSDGDRTDGERQGLNVDGHTFWRASSAGRAVELTTTTGIELDGERLRWTVATPGAERAGEPVESGSYEVRQFMAGMLAAMQRVTRRATMRPPVPKPMPKPTAPLPATAPVPCPLCNGGAWLDCELCDGSGIVTQRRADEWQEMHGG